MAVQPIPTNNRGIFDFRAKLDGGGVRPNLFEVELEWPSEAIPTGVTDKLLADQGRFLCKAAAMPASNIAPIEVPFRGRILKVAGDRTFDTWTVTIINDTDMALRGAFERWMNLINKVSNNAGRVNPAEYQTIAKVHQLGRANVSGKNLASEANIPILRSYEFQGVFPTNVSQVDLSYESTDTIEEFTVELQVQYWTATGNGGAVA
jgi:hypothetical protein|tara:strand:- start:4941 stop:5558 length:618 start_codon:yes stop_codon:yes gene_type:complete